MKVLNYGNMKKIKLILNNNQMMHIQYKFTFNLKTQFYFCPTVKSTNPLKICDRRNAIMSEK